MVLFKTRTQLINEAASKLRIRALGQPLEAEYSATIDDKIDALVEQLASERIAEIPDIDEIPIERFDPLACLLANRCAPDFGQDYDYQKEIYHKALLKKIVSGESTREVLESEYF